MGLRENDTSCSQKSAIILVFPQIYYSYSSVSIRDWSQNPHRHKNLCMLKILMEHGSEQWIQATLSIRRFTNWEWEYCFQSMVGEPACERRNRGYKKPPLLKKIHVEVDLHSSHLCCTKVNWKWASDKVASRNFQRVVSSLFGLRWMMRGNKLIVP